MTAYLVTTIKKFIGLSTDTKPLISIPVGSVFYETNTGQPFIWNGNNWVEDLTLIYAFTEALKEI